MKLINTRIQINAQLIVEHTYNFPAFVKHNIMHVTKQKNSKLSKTNVPCIIQFKCTHTYLHKDNMYMITYIGSARTYTCIVNIMFATPNKYKKTVHTSNWAHVHTHSNGTFSNIQFITIIVFSFVDRVRHTQHLLK